MNKNIHPNYHTDAKFHCACGKTWPIGSTSKENKIAMCGNCHPFYTGQEKIVDTRGRVEKFKKRMEKAHKKVGK